MFRSKKVNMVIAVVVAILLWMYVVEQVNPITTKKFSQVPVTLVGEEVLNERGLAVAEVETDCVDVTLEGTRSDLGKVEAEVVVAALDVSELEKGRNTVPVAVTIPDKTELNKVSVENINVTVEERVVEEKEVKVTFEGIFENGSEPGQVTISPEFIEVAGAQSVVNRVEHVQAVVKADEVKDNRIETEAGCQPVDAAGVKVEHVEMSRDAVYVSAKIMSKKIVDLKVETVGEVEDGYVVDDVEVASQITIKGPKDVLDGITQVEAEPLDISGLKETSSIPLRFLLPRDVEVAVESASLQAVVSIRRPGAEVLKFSGEDLKVRNLKDGLTIEIKEVEITATITVKSDGDWKFSREDIEPYVDAAGLKAGTYRLKISAIPFDEMERVVFSPAEVEITISEV